MFHTRVFPFQFCKPLSLPDCRSDSIGMTIRYSERRDTDASQAGGAVVTESHTAVHCHCPAPRQWRRTDTNITATTAMALKNTTHTYHCHQVTHNILLNAVLLSNHEHNLVFTISNHEHNLLFLKERKMFKENDIK